jgi:imidazolonepropionase
VGKLLVGATQVVTCRGPGRARKGSEMAELEVLSDDPAILVGDDGLIEKVARRTEFNSANHEEVEVDGVVFPGFVDSHTHAVFGDARTEDHERRAQGVTYQEIAAAGGGILSSVKSVRETSPDRLENLTRSRLDLLLSLGTTTVEVKSGYGLELEAEIKQLDVIRRLSNGNPSIVPTFLGAHEIPPEFRDNPDEYVDIVVNEMMPVVRDRGLAKFCDVFCEPGVFTTDQSRKVLSAARENGMMLKLHADELDGSRGAELGVELGAVSADHLAAISPEGVAALSGSDTIAVILPGTMLFLGKSGHAPAREIIDRGGAVALATDFNPGSSPGMSLPLMGMMGVSQLKLLAAEAIMAITVNGAAAVGEAGTRGQIAAGFRADLAVASINDWRELVYWYGVNLVSSVWVRGLPCDSH